MDDVEQRIARLERRLENLEADVGRLIPDNRLTLFNGADLRALGAGGSHEPLGPPPNQGSSGRK